MKDNRSVNFAAKVFSIFGLKKNAKQVSEEWERDKRRTEDGLIDEIENAEGEFGINKNNPIPVNSPRGEYEYLARLRCPCGNPFFFHRAGSVGECLDGHIVDMFELICRERKHRYTLFLDMYHIEPSSKVPSGLSLSTLEGVGSTLRIENFSNMTFEEVKRLRERNH